MLNTLFRYIIGLGQDSDELIEAKNYKPIEHKYIKNVPKTKNADDLSSNELSDAVVQIVKDLKRN